MGDVVTRSLGGKKKHYIRYVDTDGKRKMRLSGQTTREAAKTFLHEVEARIRRGTIGMPEKEEIRKQGVTVGELCDRFLKEYLPPDCKNPKRYRRVYGCAIRRWIQPHIGKLRAVDVGNDPEHVQTMRDALAKDGYADNTQNQAMSVLSGMYTWAIGKRLIQCPHPLKDGLDLWRKSVSSVEHYSAEDMGKVLHHVAQNGATAPLDEAVGMYMAVAGLLTGCRKGELFGLKWSDIDFVRLRVGVNRSYSGLPKNGKPRLIPLDPGLVTYLTTWRERCPQIDDLVFPRPVYATKHPQPIVRWAMGEDRHMQQIRELLTAAGVTATYEDPWHAMRHSYATAYLEQGGDLVKLSRLLGHGSVRVTEKTYLHPSEEYLTEPMPLHFSLPAA